MRLARCSPHDNGDDWSSAAKRTTLMISPHDDGDDRSSTAKKTDD